MSKAKIESHPRWQEYIKAGFKTWESESTANLKETPYFLQKRINRGRKTLYFITVYVYECDFGKTVGFQPEVQFNTHGGPIFNVTYLENHSPKIVEKFFRKIYKVMDCKPYE